MLIKFLRRAMELRVRNIVFLIEAPAAFWTAKERTAWASEYGLRRTYRVHTPKEWQKRPGKLGTGFAACHWKLGYKGDMQRWWGRGWWKGFSWVRLIGFVALLLILCAIISPHSLAAGVAVPVALVALLFLGKRLGWWGRTSGRPPRKLEDM
jgi:hypothetical protein